MDHELSEDQEAFRDRVESFAKEEVLPRAREIDQKDIFPHDLLESAAREGLLGLLVSPEYGGSGLDHLHLALAVEELAKASPSFALTVSVQNCLVGRTIDRFGSSDRKEEFLPGLVRGELLGSFALTEPGAGSDLSSLETSAEREDGEYLVEGEKTFVTNLRPDGLSLVFAREGEELVALLIRNDSPGARVGPPIGTMGMRGSVQAPLSLEGVRVDQGYLLPDGRKVVGSALDAGRVAVAAQAVGMAQGSLEEAISHAKEREQFGRPLTRFQTMRWRIAEMATAVEGARLMTRGAARLLDGGVRATQKVSMAKLSATRAAMEVTSEAIQVLGGRGCLAGSRVERHFRDARVADIYEGTSDVQKMIISSGLLD
ncbi:MAG: acyl-CoA dehydrogenase family protein [Methanomassiliicoccales archaeon]